MDWRRAVERSRMPSGVKLTLLTHGERGPSHWHDDETNQHAFPRKRLADRLGKDQSTVRRHYRRAERDGYLLMHQKGDRGQQAGQGRGLQTVFHYVTPSAPWPCETCQMGGRKGGTYYPVSALLSIDQNASPIGTSTTHPHTAYDVEHPPTSLHPQRLSPATDSAESPVAGLRIDTVAGTTVTTGAKWCCDHGTPHGSRPPECGFDIRPRCEGCRRARFTSRPFGAVS